ncbi:MAG: hypothetical protein ACK5TK_12915 [Betaproteobacteria bacterium]
MLAVPMYGCASRANLDPLATASSQLLPCGQAKFPVSNKRIQPQVNREPRPARYGFSATAALRLRREFP